MQLEINSGLQQDGIGSVISYGSKNNGMEATELNSLK
jgi:hypothetical protein